MWRLSACRRFSVCNFCIQTDERCRAVCRVVHGFFRCGADDGMQARYRVFELPCHGLAAHRTRDRGRTAHGILHARCLRLCLCEFRHLLLQRGELLLEGSQIDGVSVFVDGDMVGLLFVPVLVLGRGLGGGLAKALMTRQLLVALRLPLVGIARLSGGDLRKFERDTLLLCACPPLQIHPAH